MKKYILTLIIIPFLLTGCSKQKEQEIIIENPYEISVNNEILSYYSTQDGIPSELKILDTSISNAQDKTNNNVLINSDGEIRCISIIDNTVNTYKQISVGDDIDKVENSFEYEIESNKSYLIKFDKYFQEISLDDSDETFFTITYFTNNNKITRILISDIKYANELR